MGVASWWLGPGLTRNKIKKSDALTNSLRRTPSWASWWRGYGMMKKNKKLKMIRRFVCLRRTPTWASWWRGFIASPWPRLRRWACCFAKASPAARPALLPSSSLCPPLLLVLLRRLRRWAYCFAKASPAARPVSFSCPPPLFPLSLLLLGRGAEGAASRRLLPPPGLPACLLLLLPSSSLSPLPLIFGPAGMRLRDSLALRRFFSRTNKNEMNSRQVGSHRMNELSSRSHVIFRLEARGDF